MRHMDRFRTNILRQRVKGEKKRKNTYLLIILFKLFSLQVITMCMCVTLSASVTLIFLFLPKLYIIVLRPERNNRALFTTSKSIRCHIGARVAAAIAEPPSKQTIYRLSGSDANEPSEFSLYSYTIFVTPIFHSFS